VRTISAETSNAILRQGGQYLTITTPAVYDGRNDRWEASGGDLGAPGGLMEVVYLRDPRVSESYLWRGYRSPVGGMGSLFNESTMKDKELEGYSSELDDSAREMDRKLLSGALTAEEQEEFLKKSEEARKDLEWTMNGFSRPLTDGVLYLGFSFWGPTTNTWDEVMPLASAGGKRDSGPLFHWDSTRAILDWPGDSGEFTFRSRDGSLTDSSDDIFPQRVEITLVLRDDNSESLYLVERISKSAESFRVSKPLSLPDDKNKRYILVGDEWMYMREVNGTRVSVGKDGRGWRGTEPGTHLVGSRVDIGVTFRRVAEMPGSRKSRSASERTPVQVKRKDP
jgi:hypothetical protein